VNQPGSIESMKRSDTAELRRRFDDITKFLADGYNHKQICEHLNSEGLAIPYSNYRAIMTRLRRERLEAGKNVVQAVQVRTTVRVPEVRARTSQKRSSRGTQVPKLNGSD